MATVSVDGYVFTFLRSGDRVRVCWSSPWRSGLHFECAAAHVLENVDACIDNRKYRDRILRATETVLTNLMREPA